MNKTLLILASVAFTANTYAAPQPVPDAGSTALLGLVGIGALIAARNFIKKS